MLGSDECNGQWSCVFDCRSVRYEKYDDEIATVCVQIGNKNVGFFA